jgi:hypothetical protein
VWLSWLNGMREVEDGPAVFGINGREENNEQDGKGGSSKNMQETMSFSAQSPVGMEVPLRNSHILN